MSDRVVVFIDYQNTYMAARRAFHKQWDDAHCGQINPRLLGLHLAADSPFDRELTEVRVYRGLPSSSRDPRGYGAARRQIDAWRNLGMVSVFDRPLHYPHGWPDSDEKPREKGIDVALAIDFAVMGLNRQYDVGILVSLDTDMHPALEVIYDRQRAWGRPRAEVAAFRNPSGHSRRLALSGAKIFCHWIDGTVYDRTRDDRDYNVPS